MASTSKSSKSSAGAFRRCACAGPRKHPARISGSVRLQPDVMAMPIKSGFVSFLGRPNAGKSTLLNRIVGHKLAIVSDKPQTTRTRIVGVKNYGGPDKARPTNDGANAAEVRRTSDEATADEGQIVFVDTAGVH